MKTSLYVLVLAGLLLGCKKTAATLDKKTLTVSGNALTLDFPVESMTTLVIN